MPCTVTESLLADSRTAPPHKVHLFATDVMTGNLLAPRNERKATVSTTRSLLLLGVVVIAVTVWKACGSSGGPGDVKVTGRDGSEQIAEVSHGEQVELGDHIAPRGRTLFELGAEW
jgi:hypothetical protein